MIPAHSNVYLETSAVNYLDSRLTLSDAAATRAHHALKGTKFYVSPVTIWEILLTKNVARRESLILFLQNLAYHELLNSPSEFVINYITAGCPKVEKKYLIHSKLPLAATWSDVAQDTNKTFVFDQKELAARSQRIRKGFKFASTLIRDVGVVGPNISSDTASRLGFEGILKQMKTVDYRHLSGKDRRQFKISILLILIMLCYGIEFDNAAIEKFWAHIGIRAGRDRLAYLLTTHENLVYRGPFWVLSETVMTQLNKGGRPTRGIFWDALHSMYVIYTDIFLTADKHFKNIQAHNSHLAYKRIVFLPDARIFSAR
jgi:diacylglycerol kinase